jgi:hypothetical protein
VPSSDMATSYNLNKSFCCSTPSLVRLQLIRMSNILCSLALLPLRALLAAEPLPSPLCRDDTAGHSSSGSGQLVPGLTIPLGPFLLILTAP